MIALIRISVIVCLIMLVGCQTTSAPVKPSTGRLFTIDKLTEKTLEFIACKEEEDNPKNIKNIMRTLRKKDGFTAVLNILDEYADSTNGTTYTTYAKTTKIDRPVCFFGTGRITVTHFYSSPSFMFPGGGRMVKFVKMIPVNETEKHGEVYAIILGYIPQQKKEEKAESSQ